MTPKIVFMAALHSRGGHYIAVSSSIFFSGSPYAGRPRPWPHCVRWGPSSPLPKGHSPPIFRPISVAVQWLQRVWIKMSLGMELGLSPGDFVLDGDPVPFPQKGAEPPPPQFSAHFYCDQTAACIKMPLGIELGLGQGDFVLDGDPAPPSPKGA